uniref:hypothetical protein n=1 Tax=Desulfosarcina alkanivorans TaxID=571177 RepID=UPI0012D31AF6|nr:hypothetical protein [Desulfosarcina alkanivorans]
MITTATVKVDHLVGATFPIIGWVDLTSEFFQIGHRIHAENKGALAVPPVKMVGKAKIGIPSQLHLLETAADQVEAFIDPWGTIMMGSDVA